MDLYHKKYLKYKNKYVNLKKLLYGNGKDDIVMASSDNDASTYVYSAKEQLIDEKIVDEYMKQLNRTLHILENNKETVLNMPRRMREALYMYTMLERGEQLDEELKKDISDAFDVIEPISQDIIVFRGISSPLAEISLDIPNFISTSASFNVAKKFLYENICCLCIIHIPAGTKVIYIPKEIHYHDDDEKEILLQGNTTFSILNYDKRRKEYTLKYNIPPLRKLNLSNLIKFKKEIKDIEELNDIALFLGSKKDKVITRDNANEFITFLQSNQEKAKIFYDIIIDELKPIPFIIALRPHEQYTEYDVMMMDGKIPKKTWDIPKGVPFARISIILLLLIIYVYPELTNSVDLILPTNNPYTNIKLLCDKLNLNEYFIFDRIGGYELDSISYNIALQFRIPQHSDSEYPLKFVNLLIQDTDIHTLNRRIELLKNVKAILPASFNMKVARFLEKHKTF